MHPAEMPLLHMLEVYSECRMGAEQPLKRPLLSLMSVDLSGPESVYHPSKRRSCDCAATMISILALGESSPRY